MAEINLLKNQLRDASVVSSKRNRFIIVCLVSVLIIELALGGFLFAYKQSLNKKKESVVNSNTQTQGKLNTKQNELGPAKALQAQLKNLSRLVDSHVYWTNLFDELTKVTLKKIKYTQIQVDMTGKGYVEGLADNYTDLGKLLLGLATSKNFTDIRLLSSNPSFSETSGLTFAIEFKIKPELLSKNK